ncbi:MAG: hypothetical protein DWQ37_07315 [Planctomycetota bacterium]|nr:MAG: hypothetical protein DWQ37_07315 [Planctomycetota bacterium]
MSDDEATLNLWRQINRLWVGPEIERRKAEGRLPEGFSIRRCLIKLFGDRQSIVEFNDEIHWVVKAKKPLGLAFKNGSPVFLSQLERIVSVERPTVDGKPVAFLYVYSAGPDWQILFDGDPHHPCAHDEWEIGKLIADSLNLEFREMALVMHDANESQIQAIGLWPAPALMPYPLSAIAAECHNRNLPEARRILVDYCTNDFLRGLTSEWNANPVFADREQLFQDAIDAHCSGKYTLSISTLLPHIEGVVTDWLQSLKLADVVPFRQESKAKQFSDVLTAANQQTHLDRRLIDATMAFVLRGPVFATFKKWIDPICEGFPNRHAIGHGKYDRNLFSRENSVKVILLLDSLFRFMQQHRTSDDG